MANKSPRTPDTDEIKRRFASTLARKRDAANHGPDHTDGGSKVGRSQTTTPAQQAFRRKTG
ncbi:DUF5302 domain-containing protein [Actinokineospora pegani]|uniref:DUF5302 domain-containing protein n=1 Tax=Actinokineospora pegani TaxID=2654637 RepID=UPI0012EA4D9D|nr:DUF5302 domain-containing protein [Actinokineospora pegani]